MKKLLGSLLLLITFLSSCGNNEPKDYTSISGLWKCTETSGRGQRTYGIDILKTSNSSTYLISNFDNSGYSGFNDITVTLTNYTLTINEGQQAGDVIVNSGSGTVSEDFKEITLEYQVFDNGQDITINAVYKR